jgi:hypothetical protein
VKSFIAESGGDFAKSGGVFTDGFPRLTPTFSRQQTGFPRLTANFSREWLKEVSFVIRHYKGQVTKDKGRSWRSIS